MDIEAPDWANTGKVHDWKNHVPEEVRIIWSSFTTAQKLALYQWSSSLADNEEWD